VTGVRLAAVESGWWFAAGANHASSGTRCSAGRRPLSVVAVVGLDEVFDGDVVGRVDAVVLEWIFVFGDDELVADAGVVELAVTVELQIAGPATKWSSPALTDG
jgi:hypothetical protein